MSDKLTIAYPAAGVETASLVEQTGDGDHLMPFT